MISKNNKCFSILKPVYVRFLGLHMNGAHQVLAYANDVKLVSDDIRTIERNADVLLNACNDIGLVVNREN